MKTFRLLYSKPADIYKNMAIDEAIFISYLQLKKPTLRIYSFVPGGISLGYFQQPSEVLNIKTCKERNIGFVRRITGGKAIFHSQEFAYSLVCSLKDIDIPFEFKQACRIISGFLINLYSQFGLKAEFADNKSLVYSKPSSFCFSSYLDYDILIEGKKLGGSAQRRKRDLIFQQGVIPLSLDFKLLKRLSREDISGIEERATSLNKVLNRGVDFTEVYALARNSFEETFSCQLKEDVLSFQELSLARLLEEKRYRNPSWNFKRIFFLEKSLCEFYA